MMMSRLFLLSCLFLSTCPFITAQNPFSCVVQATANGHTAFYDLTQLHKSPDFYKVFGEPDSVAGTSKYTYAFNVCDQVVFPDDPTLAANWSKVCAEKTHDSVSSAYQVWFDKKDDRDSANCKSLGLWDASNKTTGYALNSDLSKGVSILYEGGTECLSGKAKGIKRSFYITVFCDADGSSNPEANVHEDSQEKCSYEIIFRSPAGCPTSCPLVAPDKKSASAPKVCASNGVCGNDQDKGPRCFCNSGYNGNDCMTPDSELDSSASCSGVCVGLIFVLILLIVLLIGGSIIYYRVHKLSTMNITFSALTESFATNAGVENRHDDEEDAGDVNLHTKNPIRGTRGGNHAAPSSSDFVVDDLND